jgi:hypothetical protein
LPIKCLANPFCFCLPRNSQSIFPTRLHSQICSKNDLYTINQGFRLATSIGGTLTGRGGNFIIIDDPIKPGDANSEVQIKKVN